jgi:hypothetical protein
MRSNAVALRDHQRGVAMRRRNERGKNAPAKLSAPQGALGLMAVVKPHMKEAAN